MGSMLSIPISVDNYLTHWWDICQLEENLDELKISLEEVKEVRNDVMRRVQIAEAQLMQRLDPVQGWLSRVEVMEIEASGLIVEASREVERRCLGCLPLNYISTCNMGKKVTKMKDKLDALKSKGIFGEVADWLPSSSVDERPNEPTVGLESMFGDVLRCIVDEGVRIIGLYGMGGARKTTLMTKINNMFCSSPNYFDLGGGVQKS